MDQKHNEREIEKSATDQKIEELKEKKNPNDGILNSYINFSKLWTHTYMHKQKHVCTHMLKCIHAHFVCIFV